MPESNSGQRMTEANLIAIRNRLVSIRYELDDLKVMARMVVKMTEEVTASVEELENDLRWCNAEKESAQAK